MKVLFLSVIFSMLSTSALANSIDPANTEFPWMNSPSRDGRYIMGDHPSRVHVFEAFSAGCTWCAFNAPQVKAMAEEYTKLSEINDRYGRVQFIDLGLDEDQASYQNWIARHNPPFPVVKDEGRNVWAALNQTNGIPQTFVVDCNGELVDHTIGYWNEGHKVIIRQAIDKALEVVCN